MVIYSRGAATPNDPKLSDGRGWRGPCMAGGKAAAEARAVTAAPVRCSAWLGVAVISEESGEGIRKHRLRIGAGKPIIAKV